MCLLSLVVASCALAWSATAALAAAPTPKSTPSTTTTTPLAVGAPFPDLAFRDAKGQPVKLSDLRGKVVILHFWGSWCGPCLREMPAIQTVWERSGKSADAYAFVPLQVRESFIDTARWAKLQKLSLPLFDSGAASADDGELRLASGGVIQDRELASVFPTTYVLDRDGKIAMRHIGPIEDWTRIEPLLHRLASPRQGAE